MVVQDAPIIPYTLLIHSSPIVVLFDFVSAHMFMSRTFVDMIGMTIDDLGYDLVVSSPVGVVLTMDVFFLLILPCWR